MEANKSFEIEHIGKEDKYIGKEDDFQMATNLFMKLTYPKRLAWHTPNGGSRNKIEAGKLKRMGVLPGVSDWVIWEPRKGYNGFAIELKVKGGRLTANQKTFLENCEKRNIKAVVCWNVDSFIGFMDSYFG